MIRVHCFTYLDEHKQEQWPSKLAARPLIGDRVECSNGMRLKVVLITHAISKNPHKDILNIPKPEPILKVELHKE